MTTEEEKKPQYISFMALITRKKGTTHAEFLKHWKENHAPLVAPWAKKHGIIKYRQYHLAENSDAILGEGNPNGYPVMQIDGIVEIEAPSFEAYARAVEDPYYRDVLAVDEAKFFEQELVQVGVGMPNNVVDGGKVLIDYTPVD